MKLMENANTDDIAILYALKNRVNKLPRSETAHIIGETELISNYLDPLLSPMFHQPDKCKLFRWLNQTRNETAKQRPDRGVTITEQMHESFAAGFIEVKSFGMTGHHFLTHKNTLRLTIFCKETIDRGEVKCTLGVQAIGMFDTYYKNKSMLINTSQASPLIFTCADFIMKEANRSPAGFHEKAKLVQKAAIGCHP
ncbi:hypothetical protein G6F57_010330 [Rhizopus arrhizus]|nr:hypothetical protein G6F23_006297 [Rhizopus arrhizus]KAG1417180.1 hypothetical protein G6F58_005638 [Rhizopus delemar]KAG0757767.1 hypothetical protein G6F24_010262 [Rhizopus arrhizus]KAG0783896.1 hypothetical protein G6F21_010251 [Rhizopus arrhizus]KAG0793440.1 hypothetical protein G6F22_005605 [Rhizopus arrhizus]